MTELAAGMAMTDEQVRWYCERLLERWSEKHKQIIDFRNQRHMSAEWDQYVGEVDDQGNPVDESPFKGMQPFQTALIDVAGEKTCDRLTENEAIIDVKAPRTTVELDKKANDIASIANTWVEQIQERSGESWARQMSAAQVWESYAVMHTRRCDEIWPGMKREQGESADAYLERRARTQAHYGPGWHVEFPDPVSFVPVLDRHPRGGLAMALLSYEVYLLDYERAFNEGEDDQATALYDLNPKIDVGQEQPAPGMQDALGSSGQTHETPSSSLGDPGQRVHIYQLWTRDEYYEAVGQGHGGFELRKSFKHDYGEVPFYIVPARMSTDPDPCRRWKPYLWPLYQSTPSANRFFSLFMATMEINANPVYMTKQAGGVRGPMLPDGTPSTAQMGTDLEGEIGEGTDIVQLKSDVTAGMSQALEFWTQYLRDITPDSGFFEIDSRSAPWTARIGQSQASVGPKNLLTEQDKARSWLCRLWLRWHARHPEEEMAAFAKGEDGQIDRAKVLRVEAKDLDLFLPVVHTDATSQAELIAATEHSLSLLERQLMTHPQFYEEARGAKDPEDEARKVRVYWEMLPYFQQSIRQYAAAKYGSKFIAGMNGELVGPAGQPTNPYDVAAAGGFKPQRPANGTGAMTQTTSFPQGGLPNLQAPNTMTLPGNPGIGAG